MQSTYFTITPKPNLTRLETTSGSLIQLIMYGMNIIVQKDAEKTGIIGAQFLMFKFIGELIHLMIT